VCGSNPRVVHPGGNGHISFGYERIQDALLEGFPRSVGLYRVSRSASAVGF
jgi:hypothetical protein